ncbi:MAG: DUF2306 domain-containing protein [Pseudomonadota bacterium]
MNLIPLFNASPIIQLHVIAAILGLLLGAYVLFRPKGTRLHKVLGRVWVAAAAVTALSSFFIWEIRLVGLFRPIHLLSVLTLVSLVVGVRAAMQGRIRAHERYMKSLYVTAFVITGAFTLLPGRMMNEVLATPVMRDLSIAGFILAAAALVIRWIWRSQPA